MLTLERLFTNLVLGEAKPLYLANTGVVPVEDYPKILRHLNTGLTKLHTRFPLKERAVHINQREDTTLYTLSSNHAVTNTESTDVKYIVDTSEEPFTDDILRIDSAYDEEGCEVTLNDSNACLSWYTPSFNQLQIINPVTDNRAILVYRANHKYIPIDTLDLTTQVSIPVVLEEALIYYIASKLFGSSLQENQVAEGLRLLQLYEAECQDIESRNMVQDTNVSTDTTFDMDGWA